MLTSKALATLLAMAAVIITVGAAAGFGMSGSGIELDRRMEQACHREVKKRSPLGHRELRTLAYNLKEPDVGLANGSLKSELTPNRWSQVNWACHLHVESGRILRVEFSFPQRGNRLKAISSAI